MNASDRRLPRGRDDAADCLKGVLIFLVCLGHALQYSIYKNENFWDDPLFKAIYIFHMPLFMAVAGYLTRPGLTRAPSITHYVGRRFVSYLVPIVVWALLYKSLFLLAGQLTLAQFPLAVAKHAAGSLWFLWALMGALAITSIALMAERFRNQVLFALVALVMLLPDVGMLYLFQYTLPFFVAGYYFAGRPLNIGVEKHTPLIAALVLGAASIYVFINWDKDVYIYVSRMGVASGNADNVLYRWAGGFTVSAFFLVLFQHARRRLWPAARRVLAAAGAHSLYIYIVQGFVFEAITVFFARYYPDDVSLGIGYPVAIAIGAATTYFCWRLGKLLARSQTLAFLLFGKRMVSPSRREGVLVY